MEGMLFNRYEVLRPLGAGASADVYLVRDINLNKLMACKKYLCDFGTETEVNTLKELSHPGLPTVFDYRKDDNQKYLIMEYIEGMTLREYLNNHRVVPQGIAIGWILEIADILRYLHGLNPSVIYRDLKPENIMIKHDGHIKLIDFGGALLRLHTNDECREICGTRGYSAPELFRGKRPEASADIYSMGAVLFEMLTGIGVGNTQGLYLGIREYDKSLSRGLETVVLNCLRRKSKERYQTVEEMVYDINNHKKLTVGKDIMFLLRKAAIVMAYSVFAMSLIVPLYRGVREEEFPFPFLIRPVIYLAVAVLLQLFLFRFGRRTTKMKVIKSLLLTEKKNSGLLLALVFTLGVAGGLLMGVFGNTTAYAYERENVPKEIWVEMCDSTERKMLLKNDAVYHVEDKVRLEIPKDAIPEENIEICVVATGRNGRQYISRGFNVSNRVD